MVVRVGRRIEVRLDEEHRAKLAKILEARGGTVSETLREGLDRLYREVESDDAEGGVRPLPETAPELSPVDARGRSIGDEGLDMVNSGNRERSLGMDEWDALVKHLQDTAPELPPWEVLKEEIAHAHCPGGEFCDDPALHEPLVR